VPEPPAASAFVWSLGLGLVAAAANVVGGLVVIARRHWNELFLKYFIALGAGFMLAATFLRMLPESFELTPFAAPLVLAGYFLVHFFEHTIAPHFHFGEEVHGDEMLDPVTSLSAVAGLAIHTFFDGVSIASGFLVSAPLGVLIFCAVILHKLPEGFTVASIALASGRSKREAFAASCVLAGATVLGVLGMNRFAWAVAWALPLSTGVTLYVAATDLMPEVNEARGIRMALVAFLGVGVFYLTEQALHSLGIH
jgi:ZIP family zinc transporter/zinc and cadmium transporter